MATEFHDGNFVGKNVLDNMNVDVMESVPRNVDHAIAVMLISLFPIAASFGSFAQAIVISLSCNLL